jgi:hypothetical protein
MHQRAQLRLKKDAIERLGAEAYVVMALDSYRTRIFKEENLLLGGGKGPFGQEKSLVFATALADPAGRASALYGVSRQPRHRSEQSTRLGPLGEGLWH